MKSKMRVFCLCVLAGAAATVIFLSGYEPVGGRLNGSSPDVQSPRENCRLFGLVTGEPDQAHHFFREMDSFRFPSSNQNDGWSLAWYSNYWEGGLLGIPGQPQVVRSHIPIHHSPDDFRTIAKMALNMSPDAVIGHLRNASSGSEIIADPHPFMRKMRGKHYLFAHNGGVWNDDLKKLKSLVPPSFQPENCPNNPIDSEFLFLYFCWLLTSSGENEFDSLKMWAVSLLHNLTDEWNALNILLSDGKSLWAVRCVKSGFGFTLHWRSDAFYRGFVLSTEALNANYEPISNCNIVQFTPGRAPRFAALHPVDSSHSEK